MYAARCGVDWIWNDLEGDIHTLFIVATMMKKRRKEERKSRISTLSNSPLTEAAKSVIGLVYLECPS